MTHRPRPTDQDRRQHQERGRHCRNPHVAQEDHREEGQGTQHGDREQDELGRQLSVNVGVAGAGERRLLAATRQQPVSVEPVCDRLQQDECGGEHRELNAGGPREHSALTCHHA